MVFAKSRDECSPMVWCHPSIPPYWMTYIECPKIVAPCSMFVFMYVWCLSHLHQIGMWHWDLAQSPLVSQSVIQKIKNGLILLNRIPVLRTASQLRLGRRSSLQYRFLIKLSSLLVRVNIYMNLLWCWAGDHWPPSWGVFLQILSPWHFYNCGLQIQLWL